VAEVNNHELEVWIDVSFIEKKPIKIGHLKHDRGNVRFNYDEAWLSHPQRFDIDPDLSLDNAIFHPNPAQGNFGVFLDSSPDRWGQTLMKRREAMEAKDEGRQARTLYAWDYLIGVQDQTRQGALRFKYPGTDVFLASHDLSAPPVAQLAARPKANFTQQDGSLWIAKFPAKDDDRDSGAWEMLAYQLAIRANIQMPQAKLLKLGSQYRTFAVKRFDRIDGQRIHYASAMTMLKKESSDDASYLDIAEFIMTRGATGSIKDDLAQLFRRVVFNAAISNRDDHLRNHGFILMPNGWRLSPAFDINPNIDKAEHALNLDIGDNRANLESVIATAQYYELTQDQAVQIVSEILSVTRTWEAVAKNLAISRGDIELMRAAFQS